MLLLIQNDCLTFHPILTLTCLFYLKEYPWKICTKFQIEAFKTTIHGMKSDVYTLPEGQGKLEL
jgi:hypothetical protein